MLGNRGVCCDIHGVWAGWEEGWCFGAGEESHCCWEVATKSEGGAVEEDLSMKGLGI